MRLKIEDDGSSTYSAVVRDADTGELLENVTDVVIHLRPGKLTTATVEVVMPDIFLSNIPARVRGKWLYPDIEVSNLALPDTSDSAC